MKMSKATSARGRKRCGLGQKLVKTRRFDVSFGTVFFGAILRRDGPNDWAGRGLRPGSAGENNSPARCADLSRGAQHFRGAGREWGIRKCRANKTGQLGQQR